MHRIRLALCLLLAQPLTTACMEQGSSANCPPGDYKNADGTIDEAKFDAWRLANEEAGCLTPIGGTPGEGGAGG